MKNLITKALFVIIFFSAVFMTAREKNLVVGEYIYVPKATAEKEIASWRPGIQVYIAFEAIGWLEKGTFSEEEMEKYRLRLGTGKYENYYMVKNMIGIPFCLAVKQDNQFNNRSWHYSKDILEIGNGDDQRNKFQLAEPVQVTEAVKAKPEPLVIPKPVVKHKCEHATPEGPVTGAQLSKEQLISQFYPEKSGDLRPLQLRSDAQFFHLEPQQIFAARVEMLPEVSGQFCRVSWSGLGQIDYLEQYTDILKIKGATHPYNYYPVAKGENSVEIDLKYGHIIQFVIVDELSQGKIYLNLSDKYLDERLPPTLEGLQIVEIPFFIELKNVNVSHGLKIIK